MSDDEIKREIYESSRRRSCEEIISIHEVCLDDKFDRRYFGFHGEAVLPTSGRNDLDVSRYFRELGLEESSMELLPDPGMPFRDLGDDDDLELIEDSDISSSSYTSRAGIHFARKPVSSRGQVTSTSSNSLLNTDRPRTGASKVDAADPRSRFHYVKYMKRQGRTVKLWECGICSREFQHQYTLMRHLPTHTDERNFHCDICGKSFRQLSTLSQHKAIHSSERPYSCEVCRKTFNRVSTLISHRKTHSDMKPYRCHLCPKGFHQKGNLRNHLFTHSNERPYRCNICHKGFNQQSNLVCHKNKAHPEDGTPVVNQRRQVPRRSGSTSETHPDSNRPQESEVTSSVGPYLPSTEGPSSSSWVVVPMPSSSEPWTPLVSNGVMVDQINTFHMGVAMAMKQTPFALLKSDNGTPALVKVVDTKLPNGKQMLVPATAEDLRVGGKIILNNDGTPKVPSVQEPENAVQLRIPVVATVIPTMRPGGRLHFTVEEPHYAYHTALSANGQVQVEPCTNKSSRPSEAPQPSTSSFQPPPLPPLQSCPDYNRPVNRISSSCSLPPPAPSPPLDLISLDLFDPIECITTGPQVIPVDNMADQVPPPPSDDSDVFITEFEESIPLSD